MPFAIAAGIGAIGSLAGGLFGGSAAQSAANTQANAAMYASNIENQQWLQTQKNLAPFMQAGTNALPAYLSALGLGGTGTGGSGAINTAGYTASPGYQFQFGQGVNAINNAASNTGGVTGGNTLKALTGYGQGLASTNFQQYLNNLYQTVGMGQNAAAGLGQLGAANANQVGANTIGAGNALAAGQVGTANALTGGINGLGGNALLYSLLNQQQPQGIDQGAWTT